MSESVKQQHQMVSICNIEYLEANESNVRIDNRKQQKNKDTKMIQNSCKCDNTAEIETIKLKLISTKLNEILSTCEEGEITIENYTQLIKQRN